MPSATGRRRRSGEGRRAARPLPAPLQARKQDLVRAAIWDAAIERFAAGGFERTTIEEIAAAAGVSTRTFFRYFASKNDLMGQGMVRYRTLLVDAIASASRGLGALAVVRAAAARVAAEAAAAPRIREIVQIAAVSVAAREAQLSRRADVEDGIAEAFAVRFGRRGGDELTPRLLGGLTLTVLDVTFRVWSASDRPIDAVVEAVFTALAALAAPAAPAARTRGGTAKRGR